MTERTPGWYITTDRLANGGRVVSGPYSTCDDALRARCWVEIVKAPTTYWVDEQPAAMAGETDQ